MNWFAEVVTCLDGEYPLRIDLREDETHLRATVCRGSNGEVVLRIYPGNDGADIPVAWLRDVLRDVEAEIPDHRPQTE